MSWLGWYVTTVLRVMKLNLNGTQRFDMDLFGMNETSAKLLMVCLVCTRTCVCDIRILSRVPMSDIPADYDGRTGLHLSAAEGHVACAVLLLDHGADVNYVDRFGRTGMRFGSKRCHCCSSAQPMHEQCASRCPLDVPLLYLTDSDRMSCDLLAALREAVLTGQDEMVELLCARGGKLMMSEPELAATLLDAAHVGDTPLVERYLVAGADQDTADYDSRTALMLAAAEGETRTCKLLLAHGANPTLTDRRGHSAVDEATGALADLLKESAAQWAHGHHEAPVRTASTRRSGSRTFGNQGT
jgi:hypothetical protein